jgi:hypothetical protein
METAALRTFVLASAAAAKDSSGPSFADNE